MHERPGVDFAGTRRRSELRRGGSGERPPDGLERRASRRWRSASSPSRAPARRGGCRSGSRLHGSRGWS